MEGDRGKLGPGTDKVTVRYSCLSPWAPESIACGECWLEGLSCGYECRNMYPW